MAWLVTAILVTVTLPAMLEGRLAEGDYDVPNPIGIASLGDTEEQLFTIVGPFLLLAIALSLASLIFRYRRGSTQERQQLKWIALGMGAFLIVTILEDGFGLRIPVVIFPLTMMALPVSTAIAVLRYRLYDIDRIISRTLAYTLLSSILAGSYLVLVLALQSLQPIRNDSPLIVAVSTLLVVAVFGPLRSRVKRSVDRRFNRARYDAERTVESFSRRLRSETDLESLGTDLLSTVRQTVHPSHVSLWLTTEGRGP
ncbi:MAG: hypothetical protein ACRDJL_06740 [Actinomycetota bacterium]